MADDIEIELPTADGGWAEIDTGGLRPSRSARRPQAPVRRRRRRWQAAGVAVMVALVGAALVRGGGGDPSTTAATATTVSSLVTTTATAATTPTSTQAFSAAPAADGSAVVSTVPGPGSRFTPGSAIDGRAVAVDGLAGPTATGLRLVALGTSGGVYDIDVDAGTITLHDISPQTHSSAPTWLAAGADWVVVRPYDNIDNYLLRDGRPPTPLTGLLADGTFLMLRGPGDSVWIETQRSSEAQAIVRVGLDGTALGPAVSYPDLQPLGTDGNGALLLRGTGGVYSVGDGPDPATPARVTTGEVLAASAGHLLLVECDTALQCTRWLVDRATGDRTDLGPDRPRGYGDPAGSISPDGRHAVVLRTDGLRRWEEVGTTAPGVVPVPVPLLSLNPEEPATIAWSTDSRYLVYLGASRLWLFDTTTATDRPLVPLEAGFPDVSGFGARTTG